jgi:LacI family transcriptional regulator
VSVRIAVAAAGANYQRTVQTQLKKLLQPGQTLADHAVIRRDDAAYERVRLLRLLDGQNRPAALISISFRPDRASIDAFRAAGVPIVLIDEQAEGASTVACDGFLGGYMAGQHLGQAGRRSLALLCGPTGPDGHYNAVQRRKGFEKALAEQGLALPAENVVEVTDYSRQDGISALEGLLARGRKLDAIFCAAGDASATGVLAAARDRRIPVPEQLAVLGFDDMPMASISEPPLSTFRQPMEALAREALRLATEDRAAILARPRTVLLEPKLVVRASA